MQRFQTDDCQPEKYIMKKISSFIILFSLFFFFGCNKTNSSLSLQGTWELRHLDGGYRAPGSPTDFAPGNGNIWKFTSGTYQYFSEGELSGTGEFTKTKDYAIATGRKMDAIILNGSADDKIYFEIKDNVLTMYHGTIAADGTVATYEKIKTNP